MLVCSLQPRNSALQVHSKYQGSFGLSLMPAATCLGSAWNRIQKSKGMSTSSTPTTVSCLLQSSRRIGLNSLCRRWEFTSQVAHLIALKHDTAKFRPFLQERNRTSLAILWRAYQDLRSLEATCQLKDHFAIWVTIWCLCTWSKPVVSCFISIFRKHFRLIWDFLSEGLFQDWASTRDT